jgi:hypothetical protein
VITKIAHRTVTWSTMMDEDDEPAFGLILMAQVVVRSGEVWIRCNRMVSTGRGCREMWSVDEANSDTIIRHITTSH